MSKMKIFLEKNNNKKSKLLTLSLTHHWQAHNIETWPNIVMNTTVVLSNWRRILAAPLPVSLNASTLCRSTPTIPSQRWWGYHCFRRGISVEPISYDILWFEMVMVMKVVLYFVLLWWYLELWVTHLVLSLQTYIFTYTVDKQIYSIIIINYIIELHNWIM